jgi:UDP-N-acetylmuramoyl-L-alanyl-D-glutamate--2,6-diaminopimelate ligase
MNTALIDILNDVEMVETRGDLQHVVHSIAYDSRQVERDDVFVAIRGTRQDGSRFIGDALKRGAIVIIADEPLRNGDSPAVFVRVKDSRKALAKLSANYYHHPSDKLQVIGVTGTNGKTSTTLILENILKMAGHRSGVLGTLAYRWGDRVLRAPMTTPESLDLQRLFHEMQQDRVTHVVMEVSSHALSLGRVDGTRFRAAVFTNLSQDHLDYHTDMEDYFAVKSRLFTSHLRTREGVAAAVINRDDLYGARLIEKTGGDVWSYSACSRDASVWVKDARLSAAGIDVELSTPGGDLKVHSPLIGRLNLYNLLCASATALSLGIPAEAVAEGVAGLASVDGRLQRVWVPLEAGYQVVVDYAHTPDAMEKSIGCLKEMTSGRLIVVFGCGGDRDRKKRPLMGRVAADLADLVILTSDNPRSEVPERIIEDIESGLREAGFPRIDLSGGELQGRGFTVEVDRRTAIHRALSVAAPGDVIFIGGKGHETYQIIGKEVLPFDDRMVVREFFDARQATMNHARGH